ncbi:MAG: hypothetical protein R3F62_29920 [Planctomycetota bacterium]
MDPAPQVISASLGQLALHYGLVSPEEHTAAVTALREAAKRGEPDSYARRLIRRGVAQRAVQHLLGLGAHLGAVLCDACGDALAQGELPRRRAYPCRRCGSLVLGFRAFLEDGARSPEDSEETAPLPFIPPPRPSSETDRYDMVLPLPDELEPGAGREAFAASLRAEEAAAPDMNQTLGFPQVFALPTREASLSDHQATQILEAMLEAPAVPRPADPRAAATVLASADDLRRAETSASADPRAAATVLATADDLRRAEAAHDPNSETLLASPEDLGIVPRGFEAETLVASAEDLGVRALAPLAEVERPRLPDRTGPLVTAGAVAEDPPLWPWLLALGVLCLATAIALGFLLAAD